MLGTYGNLVVLNYQFKDSNLGPTDHWIAKARAHQHIYRHAHTNIYTRAPTNTLERKHTNTHTYYTHGNI